MRLASILCKLERRLTVIERMLGIDTQKADMVHPKAGVQAESRIILDKPITKKEGKQ